MAGFRKDKTTSYNAALMTAGTVVEALITQGVIKTVAAAGKALVELTDTGFAAAAAVVDADNEVFAAADEAAPKSSTRAASGAKSGRAGGAKAGAKSKSSDDPGDMVLNSGKFKGCTLREVYEMSEEEAGNTYGHREGEAGATYVEWLASDRNKNGFTRDNATAFLEAA